MASPGATFNTSDKTCPGYYGAYQTALLLMDFHTMLVQKAGGPNAAAAFETATKIRDWAKKQGIQVVHCLIDVNGAPFSTCKDGERFAGIVATMKSSGGEEPAELLESGADDVTFSRTPGHVSALKSPGIEEFLQKKGIKSLVLTGLSTSRCVLRTSLAACDAEYVVTVISDACADPKEGIHDIMVGDILNNRGYVTTAAEFQQGFEKASSGT